MTIVKRIFGALALALGLVIVLWVVYNLIWPMPEFRHATRWPVQLLLPIAMIWFGWRWLSDAGPGIETLQMDHGEPELVRSREQARSTLPTFRAAVATHTDGAYIKFPLVTDAGVTEHIWAYVHHYADGVYNVSLANKPHTQKGKLDERRDVAEAEVEDWQIMTRDGRIRGGYSLRALFAYAERRRIRLNRTMRKQRAQFLGAEDDVPEPVG
jgi:uncharacterized protein YegJ (DUF2314 family)